MNPNYLRAPLALALLAALGGCATLAPQPRDAELAALLSERGGPAVDWSAVAAPDREQAALDRWLAEPMTLDAAMRVAMLRSPRLQEAYARVGLARAEVLEAVEIENPRLSFQRLSLDSGGHNRTTGLSLPLLDLLVLPAKAQLAGKEYERARFEAADAVLGVVAEVESSWYRYVTARQVAGMRAAVAEGLDASAELAGRFHAAGNISALQLAQEQAAASQARINTLHARADATRQRLELTTLIGLHGKEATWEASDTLPLPVPEEDDADALTAMAREGNLGLQAARTQAEVMADALGLTHRLRWLGGSEIGYEREREASGERLRGPELSLELPIFNQGQARIARAEARLAEALARVQVAEIGAVNGVRTGADAVATMREVVRLHREALVPQREAIVARQQERQNFMLIGVFELIQAKVAEYDAYQAYLESIRDYWLARVELARVVGRRLPSDAAIGARAPALDDVLGPEKAPVMDHSRHGGMDHSQHQGMDPPQRGEMDRTRREGANPSQHEGMDHSEHGGMNHPEHGEKDPAPSGAGEDDGAEPQDDDRRDDPHAHHHGATP